MKKHLMKIEKPIQRKKPPKQNLKSNVLASQCKHPICYIKFDTHIKVHVV